MKYVYRNKSKDDFLLLGKVDGSKLFIPLDNALKISIRLHNTFLRHFEIAQTIWKYLFMQYLDWVKSVNMDLERLNSSHYKH